MNKKSLKNDFYLIVALPIAKYILPIKIKFSIIKTIFYVD